MRNIEVRKRVKDSGVRYWEIAEHMNISAETLCRWLRREFDEERKQSVLKAIDEILKERSKP